MKLQNTKEKRRHFKKQTRH